MVYEFFYEHTGSGDVLYYERTGGGELKFLFKRECNPARRETRRLGEIIRDEFVAAISTAQRNGRPTEYSFVLKRLSDDFGPAFEGVISYRGYEERIGH